MLKMKTINKSLIRYKLIAGAERELLYFVGIISFIIPYITQNFFGVAVGSFIFLFGTVLLRKLAKEDPLFFKTYQRHLKYQTFYPAKTPKWRVGSGYRAK